MRFFKENSYDIVRLYINQFGMTVFSLILYFASSIVGDSGWILTLYLLVSVFSTLFLYVLLYYAAWEFGAKDRIRIDSGRMVYNKNKGLYLGLLAGFPNFLFAFLSILGKGIYILSDIGFFDLLFSVPNVILRFTSAMYMGILKVVFNPLSTTASDMFFFWQSVGFVVLTAAAAFVVHFGYRMGHECRHIMDLFKGKKEN